MDDTVFGFIDQKYHDMLSKLMKNEFKMSMMGELTFFLGLQVKQTIEVTFINQVKYVYDILKKYKLNDSIPMKTPIGTGLNLTLILLKPVDVNITRV